MIRIASWNMKQRRDTWEYMRSGLKADIALVQEAVVPAGIRAVHRPGGTTARDGGARRWGSAVATFSKDITLIPVGLAEGRWRGKSLGLAPLDCVSRGHVAIAVADMADRQVTLISAYGLIEFGYASGSLLRTLADLEPLFDDPDLGTNVVLAGDWNIGTWWSGRDEKYARRQGAALDLLAAYGLIDCIDAFVPEGRGRLTNCTCTLGPSCRHVWTYRRDAKEVAYQDDYFFATKPVVDLIKSAAPAEGWDWQLKRSDHVPIVVEMG